MNRTTRNLCLTGMLILSVMTGRIHAQSDDQMEQLNQERKAYFNEQLELTGEETQVFWPLYNDFQNRKMKIVEDERNTFRYTQQNADNLSDGEIVETLEKIQRLRSELCQLEQEYYGEKLPEVLPPKKVLKLYKVEWDFRRHLINKIRGHGQGGPGGKGKSREGRGGGVEPMPPPPSI